MLNSISYSSVWHNARVGYGVTANITASQRLALDAVARGSIPRIRNYFPPPTNLADWKWI
jgi:hypothetical protein